MKTNRHMYLKKQILRSFLTFGQITQKKKGKWINGVILKHALSLKKYSPTYSKEMVQNKIYIAHKAD